MKKYILPVAIICAIFSSCNFIFNQNEESINITTSGSITTLAITNSTSDTTSVYLTLGYGPMNVNNVSGIFGISCDSSLQGSFLLPPGDTVFYTPAVNTVLSGNITFRNAPLNCPDTIQFPTGINIFEFTLNNCVIGTTQQETIDISCVAGVNSIGMFTVTGGGPWNASPAYPNVTSFQNDSIYQNVGLVGIFTYGCDNCTTSTAPPNCPGHMPYSSPQTQPICNIQRNCLTSGGTVLITLIK